MTIGLAINLAHHRQYHHNTGIRPQISFTARTSCSSVIPDEEKLCPIYDERIYVDLLGHEHKTFCLLPLLCLPLNDIQRTSILLHKKFHWQSPFYKGNAI